MKQLVISTLLALTISSAALASDLGYPIAMQAWKNSSGQFTLKATVTKVSDADTIYLGELFKIRLKAIDAPELNQTCVRNDETWPCGKAATEFLSSMVLGKEVVCTHSMKDKYKRLLSICKIDGIDINKTLVENGYALSFYTDHYKASENMARNKKSGIWGGKFIVPQKWRKGER
jgi:endonuclease YncB( thermonuclease family)